MKASEKNNKDTRWVFLKKGTCSRTMFYILDREYENPLEQLERAADPLAGGTMQHGHQCGLIQGATMAIGAEAHRRENDQGKRIALAVKATQELAISFKEKAGSLDCFDITESNFQRRSGFAKYMLSGKFLGCFRLADQWAPEAIKKAETGLQKNGQDLSAESMSCASELVKMAGGSEQEMTIAAGFAGGLALSGKGCGALSIAIWMATKKYEELNGNAPYPNPASKKVLERFLEATDYEFLCENICGKKFDSLDDHSKFVQNGGCKDLLNTLNEAIRIED